MVAQEFLKFVGDLKITEYMGVEDFADKLSFQYSVLVMMLCTTIVSVKQYLSNSISCYIPTSPSGTDFDKYIENYCWVHGTIPILSTEEVPQKEVDWASVDESKRINYYQWVPFMLGIQTMFFHLPRLVWQLICYNRTGTDIENLVGTAGKASKCIGEERRKLVCHVAGMLESMLYQHRDYRQGKFAEMRRKTFTFCGIFVASKRLGTWLVFTYLVIKLLYLANAIGQLYLMQYFLGFNESFTNFGVSLASSILQGHDWQQTRIFPRVSICYVSDVRLLGGSNKYTAQCALPVNMLNEKLYIFLWFWTCMVAICTAMTIPTWIIRMSLMKNRTHFIKKFIRLRKTIDRSDKEDIHHFIVEFLRHDGIFLLRMISMNAGDVITADIIEELYDIHNSKYRERNLLKDILLPAIKEAADDDNPKLKNGYGSAPMYPDGKTLSKKASAPRASDADLSIGKQFIDYYQSQRIRALIGIDDWADRLSYFYSVIVLSICVTIVTVKTYFLSPLACHCPTNPAGSKFGAFLTETCFTTGTVALRANESLPQTFEDWSLISRERRRNYYYWVPFMLGLQLMLFYIPDLIWRAVTYNKLGTNLNTLIQESIEARSAMSVGKRRNLTNHVAESLRLILFDHRNVNTGIWSDIKRTAGKFCGIFVCSKRMGTWTIATYFFVKCLYITNALGQMYLMRHFLGFDSTGLYGFGPELARRLNLKDDWKQSLYFPRSAFCRVYIRLLGAENVYVAICALPVNLFNEKIYIFLWFWVAFVFICSVLSIPLWIWHIGFESRRLNRLHTYFCLDQLEFDQLDQQLNPCKKNPHDREHLKQFVDQFLRYDGVFIVEIINNHVGDLVTGEIVRLLWTSWVKEYADRHDFRQDDWTNTLTLEKEASLGSFSPHSSLARYPTHSSTLKHRPSSVRSGEV